jgi:endonuclease YncB( thermonuclease family)
MKVTMRSVMAARTNGVITSYTIGKTYDVDDAHGQAWVDAGLATEASEDTVPNDKPLEELSKAELQAESEKRGLSTSGTKDELRKQITEYDNKSAGGAPENKAV